MIPNTFNEWKDCIVNHCKIPLTKDFATQRLNVYTNRENPETKKFVALYGERHLERIINWLNMI